MLPLVIVEGAAVRELIVVACWLIGAGLLVLYFMACIREACRRIR